MMKAILVIFTLMTSLIAPFFAYAQEMGAPYHGNTSATTPNSKTLPTMGHITNQRSKNRLDSADKDASSVTGSDSASPVTPLDPAALSIPQAHFETLREDRTDTVREIIDPLTLRLENSGITRLVGIEIPDMNPYQPGPLAEAATTIIRDMLDGRRVKLYHTTNRNIGRVNRLQQKLYHVVIEDNESWVQGVLVRLGLARVLTTKSNPEMAQELYALERLARAEGLGLWSKDEYAVRKAEDADQYMNSFQIVEGRVVSATRRQNNIFLNFGTDWRNDFTVSVPPSESRNFNRSNMNPLDLNGKKIRVRGWIRSYNGAYIEIDHPESIERIETQPIRK